MIIFNAKISNRMYIMIIFIEIHYWQDNIVLKTWTGQGKYLIYDF